MQRLAPSLVAPGDARDTVIYSRATEKGSWLKSDARFGLASLDNVLLPEVGV